MARVDADLLEGVQGDEVHLRARVHQRPLVPDLADLLGESRRLVVMVDDVVPDVRVPKVDGDSREGWPGAH